MTRFFVPGEAPGNPARRAYAELRAYAEACTGRAVREQRIYSLSCRREGGDSETRVGEMDPCGGGTVHAIFATSGGGYAIVWRGGHTEVTKSQTYEAVEFD
jgi:hypothetical protein